MADNDKIVDGFVFTYGDINHADAGNSFDRNEENGEWVKAWKNIDGDNYEDIRHGDEILQVLTSQNKLQFTQKNIKKYLRLLMPMYTRRVEVEDLNRNFWVIGQTISALCVYLFERENKITDIHAEVIDWPRDTDKPFRDINNFVGVPDLGNGGEIDEPAKLLPYKRMYPNSNLCLLLRCRMGNYEKDYYHTEAYPYLVFYNRNTNTWSANKLLDYNEQLLGITLRVNSDQTSSYNYMNIRGHLYGITEKTPNNYYFYFPLSQLPPHDDYNPSQGEALEPPEDSNGGSVFHGMVQVKPEITTVWDNVNKGIKANLTFTVIDIARKLHFIGSESSHSQNEDEDYRKDSENSSLYKRSFTIDSISSFSSAPGIMTENPFNNWPSSEKPAKNGLSGPYYRDDGYQGSLCDMLTYKGVTKDGEETWKITSVSEYTLGQNAAQLVKIGNFMPTNIWNEFTKAGMMDNGRGHVSPIWASYTPYKEGGQSVPKQLRSCDNFYWHKNWSENTSLARQDFTDIYEIYQYNDEDSQYTAVWNSTFKLKFEQQLTNLIQSNDYKINNFIFTFGGYGPWEGDSNPTHLYWEHQCLGYFCQAFRARKGMEPPANYEKYLEGNTIFYYRILVLGIIDTFYNDWWGQNITWRTIDLEHPTTTINTKYYYVKAENQKTQKTTYFYTTVHLSAGDIITDDELDKDKNKGMDTIAGGTVAVDLVTKNGQDETYVAKYTIQLNKNTFSYINPKIWNGTKWINPTSGTPPYTYYYNQTDNSRWVGTTIDTTHNDKKTINRG